MSGRVLAVAVLFVCTMLAASQGMQADLLRDDPRPQRRFISAGRLLIADRSAVAHVVQARAAEITMPVPMPGGGSLMLTMQRMTVLDMRSRVTFMTEQGPEQRPLLPTVITYRTMLPDHGMAVFTFDQAGNISGMIDRGGERFVVASRRDADDPSAHIVRRDHTLPYACGVETESMSADLQRIVEQTTRQATKYGDRVQALDTIEMKIAIEADYQLSRAFSSRDLATSYLTELFAITSTIYERDLGVRMVISNVRMWEVSNDPYPDNMGVFNGLLGVFMNEYRNKMTSVGRDVAVFLTKRSSNGGIAATIGGICQEDGSYAAADVQGSLETNDDGFAWDFSMVAHEIGHVCGGLHTQSCIWPMGPLDSCVASEDGECVTYDMTRPTDGTIMSYCHNRISDGARMINAFHPLSRNVISAYIRSAPCMSGTAPDRTARLHGIVRDAATGEPVPGMQLTLGRYIDQIVRQVPASAGDTVVTTGPDGSYSFSGLGYGIYSVILAEGWVPVVIDNLPFQNSVSVADTVTRFDLRATRGQRAEFTIISKIKNPTLYLTLYSDQLPSTMTTVDSPWYILPVDDTTYRYSTYLPNGTYVAVPFARQATVTPSKITMTVNHTQPPQRFVMHAASSGLQNLTTIALGIVEQPMSYGEGQSRLVGGMAYTARSVERNVEIGRGIVPDDGVVVIERVASDQQYAFTIDMDTNVTVPRMAEGWVAPRFQYHTGIFAQQGRLRPTLVRTFYRFRVDKRSYEPLSNPTILTSSQQPAPEGSFGLTMPFPILIIPMFYLDLTNLQISRNGYVTFGPVRHDDYTPHPIDYGTVSRFTIAAFTGEMYPGDAFPTPDPSTPWRIAYEVSGTRPNRALRIEWQNVRVLTYDVNGEPQYVGPFTFQLQIHETGSIDMLYVQPTAIQVPFSTVIGLRGNDILDHQVIRADASLQAATAAFVAFGDQTLRITAPEQFTEGLAYHWELDRSLSVDEDASTAVAIHPSIATSSVEIHGIRGDLTVHVIDLLGNVLRTMTMPDGQRTIALQGLSTGWYTAVVLKDGNRHALPFMVAR